MPRSYFQTHSTQKKLGHRILTNCAHHKTSKNRIWGSMLDEQTTVARQPRLAHCLLLYMKFHRSPAVHFCAVCGCFSAPTAVWVAAAEAVQPAELKSLSTQPFGERGRASVSCGCLPRSSQAAFPGVRDSRTPTPPHLSHPVWTRGTPVMWHQPLHKGTWLEHSVQKAWCGHNDPLTHSLFESEGGSREQEAEAEKSKHRDSEVAGARLRVQMGHWRRGPSALQARSGHFSWLRSRACPPSALTKSSWGASLTGAESSSPAGWRHNTRGQESQVL